jgi:hypothetical protein
LYIYVEDVTMGQVTIYLDTETEKKMLDMIRKSGQSKSKWIADMIREKTRTTWPDNIIQLAGSWQDFPSLEEIRQDIGADTEREPL